MTVMEPVGMPVEATGRMPPLEDAIPELVESAQGSVERSIDHVQRHAQTCYWDVRVARWECGRD